MQGLILSFDFVVSVSLRLLLMNTGINVILLPSLRSKMIDSLLVSVVG